MQTTNTAAAARHRLLGGTGNSKLGKLVHTFSIPAISTCPGASGRCRRLCYADRGRFIMSRLVASTTAAYEATLRDDFARRMTYAIAEEFARVVRIHVAGDFYDAAYARKWAAVVAASPGVEFYAYTRSWRVPEVLAALEGLAALPNMHLWFSEDRETGPSPCVPGVRVAFLVADAMDDGMVPEHADLVFRDRVHVAGHPDRIKQIGGAVVCPHEQSPAMASVTCSKCRLCFNPLRKHKRRGR